MKIKNLIWLSVIHVFIMVGIGFAMVNTVEDIFVNVNRFYMSGMMAASMAALMSVTMGEMYRNPTGKAYFLAGGIGLFILCFLFARSQIFVGDKQFLKSMIPHHSSAIVMCARASIHDAEIRELCQNIVAGQKREIDQMKRILERLSDRHSSGRIENSAGFN